METLTVDKTQQKTMQQPILVPPGGGEKLNIAGSPISHKVKSKDTNGVFSVMEFVTPPGKVSLFMFTSVRMNLFTCWKGKLRSRLESKR